MRCLIALLITLFLPLSATVKLGIERLFAPPYLELVSGKRIGLLTNHTGVDAQLRSTIDLFKERREQIALVALFAPEHGLDGSTAAEHVVLNDCDADGVPIWSLYGRVRRPTDEMLEGIDVIVCDLQDVGTRCYTYVSTLFYMMEEAAKRGISVVVLDRPNPLGGELVDGPVMENQNRSFIGYLSVPLCHGLTIGELARYFNGEYAVGCNLQVVPMEGWHRGMTFADTGLPWVPTSPQIPDTESVACYPATLLIGETLATVSVGVGHTLPFQVVGAPWIKGKRLADALNRQKMQGVLFQSYAFTPFFGRLRGTKCEGVRLVITNPRLFRPVATQGLILGVLKTLYPQEFQKLVRKSANKRDDCRKIMGSDGVRDILEDEGYIGWRLVGYHQREREEYLRRRSKYLLYMH